VISAIHDLAFFFDPQLEQEIMTAKLRELKHQQPFYPSYLFKITLGFISFGQACFLFMSHVRVVELRSW